MLNTSVAEKETTGEATHPPTGRPHNTGTQGQQTTEQFSPQPLIKRRGYPVSVVILSANTAQYTEDPLIWFLSILDK